MCTQRYLFISLILLFACKETVIKRPVSLPDTQVQTPVTSAEFNYVAGAYQGQWQQYNIDISLQGKFSEFNSPSLFLS